MLVDPTLARTSTDSQPPSSASGSHDGTVVTRGSGHLAELFAGMRVGDYRVEKQLGEGAMGAVYAARHVVLGKRVAIKVIAARLCEDPGAVERFRVEARAIGQIHHPGIVGVHTVGVLPDGRSYLVMDWLSGETLRARLRRGRLELEDALDIIVQITRALDAAHAHLVIHRDVKPDNIYLVDVAHARPIVKLLDFGLAKLVDADAKLVATTRTGQMLGTPLYCSPEQARAKDVDHRTDTYALGCLAYELVCGRMPFVADNVAELIAAHQMLPPPRPRAIAADVPRELDGLLFAMIAKDPAERPALATVLHAIECVRARRVPSQPLTELDATGPLVAMPDVTAPPHAPSAAAADPAVAPRMLVRSRRIFAIATASVLAGMIGAVVSLRLGRGDARGAAPLPPPAPADHAAAAVEPAPLATTRPIAAPLPIGSPAPTPAAAPAPAPMPPPASTRAPLHATRVASPPSTAPHHEPHPASPPSSRPAAPDPVPSAPALTVSPAPPTTGRDVTLVPHFAKRAAGSGRRGPMTVRVASVALAAVLAAAHVAAADDADTAEALYTLGQQAYNEHRYDDAIADWQQALRKFPEPELLFNLAQAYRLRRAPGDCARARDGYAEFVRRDPQSTQRGAASELLEEMRACAAAAPSRDPETTVHATPAPSSEPGRPGRTARIAGIATAVGGATSLAAGLGFGSHAQTLAQRVTTGCATSCTWSSYASEDIAGRRDATIGYVLDGVGGLAVLAGAVLIWRGVREQPSALAVTPSAGGATVTWSGAW